MKIYNKKNNILLKTMKYLKSIDEFVDKFVEESLKYICLFLLFIFITAIISMICALI